MVEFNLSEKMRELRDNCENQIVVASKHTRDTITMVLDTVENHHKEFIKKLRMELCPELFTYPTVRSAVMDRIAQQKISDTINKLAGEELI